MWKLYHFKFLGFLKGEKRVNLPALSKNRLAVMKATLRIPLMSSAKYPPQTGPMMKPILDMALKRPNTLGLSFLGVISAKYALAVDELCLNKPIKAKWNHMEFTYRH